MMRLLALSGLVVIAACNNDSVFGRCTAPVPIAVEITLLDSVSRASVDDSARGVAQSGTYVDSLRPAYWVAPNVLEGGRQLGIYRVTVDRPGYREWLRTDVHATRQGACGNPITVHLTALLQRSS